MKTGIAAGALTERYAVEKLVRRKNDVYQKWRMAYTYPALDSICSEMMVRFDKLPRWEDYISARRGGRWAQAQEIEAEHRAWKNTVRDWAMERGIVSFRNQTAQLLKFYFAWYRWQYESRHGVITRLYGRQMG